MNRTGYDKQRTFERKILCARVYGAPERTNLSGDLQLPFFPRKSHVLVLIYISTVVQTQT